MSLHSDPSLKRGSSRSVEASSGGEEGIHMALGESLEERAKIFAQRCWDEDSSFLEPRKIAEWLGSA